MATKTKKLTAGTLGVSIAAGAFMGMFLAAGNIYAGLKVGLTFDGSLVAAIIAVVAIRLISIAWPGRFGPLHTNLTQTAASAGAFSAVAGLTNAVPAMLLDGVQPDAWLLVPWVFFVACLGVCVAVPLRRRVIETDELRFPSGRVAAQTIRTMHARSADAVHGLVVLGGAAAFSSGVTWLRDIGLPRVLDPVIPAKTTVPGSIGAFSCAKLSVGVVWSPLLFGVGAIVGLRTGLSLLLGAALAHPVAGPILASQGIIDPEARRAILGWVVWPAVGLITAGGLTSLFMGGGTFKRALTMFRGGKKKDGERDGTEGDVPRAWWLGGLALCAAGASATARLAFGVPVWQSLVAIACSLVIAALAVRAVGETDISPSNNLAKTLQFLFAALAPGQTVPNVAAAGVASGCAMEASEVMTDYKAGHMLGNRPRHQFVAQFVGIFFATGAAVAAYTMIARVIPIGQEGGLPAPTAVAWHALAVGLSGKEGAVPAGAGLAAWIAAAVGVVLTVLSGLYKKIPWPSPVAMGLGAILGFGNCFSIALGACLGALVGWLARDFWKRDQHVLTAGLIAGESLTGLVAVLFLLLGWIS